VPLSRVRLSLLESPVSPRCVFPFYKGFNLRIDYRFYQ
jgi:hypothetical protein